MKKFFIMLALLASQAIAETVYVGNTAGPRVTACRALFQAYDTTYDTKTTLLVRPGADGTIAIEKAIEENSLVCAGTDSVVSGYKMKPVLMYCYFPISFWSSTKNPANNVDVMVNRPIFIGYHLSTVPAIVKKMYPNANITFVPFKSPSEALPSVVEGTLDLYVDGGGLITMERAGKLKNVGKFGGAATGPDLSAKYPEIASVKNFCGVMAPESMPDAKVKLLNQRLSAIAKTEEFSKLVVSFNQTSYVPTLEEAQTVVNYVRKFTESVK